MTKRLEEIREIIKADAEYSGNDFNGYVNFTRLAQALLASENKRIREVLTIAKGKIGLAHYNTGELDLSWIDHKLKELK